jgi:hypothetical protein
MALPLSNLLELPSSLGQMFSLPNALGTASLSEFIPHSNGTLPLASLLSLWLFGRRLFRFRLGLLPILIIIMLMLGTDPEAARLVQGITKAELPSGLTEINAGWLTTLLVVGGAWLLLGGGALFSLPNLIAIGAVGYLLNAKDYRLAHLLQYSGSSQMIYGLGALLALLVLLRFMRPRYRSHRSFGNLFGSSGLPLRAILMYCGAMFALFTVYLIITNPTQLERAIPGWRSGAGVAMLLGALLAFGASLPQRWRAFMTPVFWAAVSIVIGAQLFAPAALRQIQRPQLSERQESLQARTISGQITLNSSHHIAALW